MIISVEHDACDKEKEIADLKAKLEAAIRWLRRLEREYPGCLNQGAIEAHLEFRE